METNKTSNRIHPLIAAAAVSVMLVSLVGVAAITGVIPTSHSSATATAVPAPTVSATPITAPAPANAPVAVAASAPAPSVDAKIAADKVVNPQPKRAAAAPAPAPAPKSYASRETRTTQPQPRTYQYAEPAVVAQAPRICNNCGRVESVQAIQQQAQPSGLGVVAGAVLGGVLGNQVGGGNGKKLATVAGAVGGGFAGNEIERRTRSTTAYEVRVRMDNGTVRTFPYNNQPNWNIGDRIKVIDGYLTTQV
jgi:outer membrane lipoprotein SlyB